MQSVTGLFSGGVDLWFVMGGRTVNTIHRLRPPLLQYIFMDRTKTGESENGGVFKVAMLRGVSSASDPAPVFLFYPTLKLLPPPSRTKNPAPSPLT